MRKLIWNAFKRWLHAGVGRQPSHTLRRKVLHTNVAALVASLSMLNLAMVAQQLANPVLIRVSYWQLPEVLLLLLIPWLNGRRQENWARWLLVVLVMGSQWLAVWLGLGTYLYTHFYFILFALLPVAFFPMRQTWAIAGLSLLNLWLFLWLEWNGMAAAQEVLALPASQVKMLRMGYTVGILVTLLVFVLLIELDAEHNERKLEKMSITDGLTGLYNRRYFEITFQRLLSDMRQGPHTLSLIMLDIDWFKQINDNHGHECGDQVLRQMSALLLQGLRQGDVVARVGGEEFAILLPHAGLSQALEVAQRLCERVAQSDFALGGLQVTISAGVAEMEPHQTTSQGYKRADDALYAAKEAGRNRVVSAVA